MAFRGFLFLFVFFVVDGRAAEVALDLKKKTARYLCQQSIVQMGTRDDNVESSRDGTLVELDTLAQAHIFGPGSHRIEDLAKLLESISAQLTKLIFPKRGDTPKRTLTVSRGAIAQLTLVLQPAFAHWGEGVDLPSLKRDWVRLLDPVHPWISPNGVMGSSYVIEQARFVFPESNQASVTVELTLKERPGLLPPQEPAAASLTRDADGNRIVRVSCAAGGG